MQKLEILRLCVSLFCSEDQRVGVGDVGTDVSTQAGEKENFVSGGKPTALETFLRLNILYYRQRFSLLMFINFSPCDEPNNTGVINNMYIVKLLSDVSTKNVRSF